MTSDESPLLSLEDVTVTFGNGAIPGFRARERVHALNRITLDIEANDVVALVGESGCGKTTLGKTAIGLHRPDQGSVRYRGQDVFESKDASKRFFGDTPEIPFRDIRRSLQMIHQDPGESLNTNYSIRSILAEPLKRWEPDLDAGDREARIHGLLEHVGMTPPEDFAARYPHQLSGGEQQRVALVRALLMNPDLILADEAISALDVSLRVEMMDLMLELQDQFDTSFLFISHNLSNARYLTTKGEGRIAVMYLGEIVEIGPPDQIIENSQHPYTRALRWATGSARQQTDRRDLPLRRIDVPDLADPPSGCSFHTRCPEAREICTETDPDDLEHSPNHRAKCYRVDSDHPYWESEELGSATEEPETGG